MPRQVRWTGSKATVLGINPRRAPGLSELLADGAKIERHDLFEALAAGISKQHGVVFAYVPDADDRFLTKGDQTRGLAVFREAAGQILRA